MTSNKNNALCKGENAELLAKDYLIKHGLRFVESNFKAKVGEIDLIFKDKNQWVFVEVKYRTTARHGFAIEYLTKAKQQKIIKTIMCYLKLHNLNFHNTAMRIDAVAIDNDVATWVKNIGT